MTLTTLKTQARKSTPCSSISGRSPAPQQLLVTRCNSLEKRKLDRLTFETVSGAIAERAMNTGYLIQVVVMGIVNYPLIAHWAWGGGWLSTFGENGYLDFAGSGVIHLTGGISGLIGAVVVGPRVGRFDAKGVPQKLPGYSTTLITLGCFILWFGWLGFNIGSTLQIVGKGTHLIISSVLIRNEKLKFRL